jgi:hypothetical protein
VSLLGLMKQPVRLYHVEDTTIDPTTGNQVPTTGAGVEVDAYVEQTDSREILVDQTTYVADWLVLLPPGTRCDSGTQIAYRGRLLEAVGPPWDAVNPRLQLDSHVEVRCRSVGTVGTVGD